MPAPSIPPPVDSVTRSLVLSALEAFMKMPEAGAAGRRVLHVNHD